MVAKMNRGKDLYLISYAVLVSFIFMFSLFTEFCFFSVATMYRKCTITSIENITHDTKLYTLSLPPTTHMAIPVGHHIKIKANENGHEIERSYTPVQPLGCSSSSSLQLMIKLYSDGSMSQHLLKLNQGNFDLIIRFREAVYYFDFVV